MLGLNLEYKKVGKSSITVFSKPHKYQLNLKRQSNLKNIQKEIFGFLS